MKIKNQCFALFLVFILLTFISCNNIKTNDTIQLWCNFNGGPNEEKLKYIITKKAKSYCEKNNITIEIVEFDPNVLSYEDYIFKRNLAAKSGNIIIVDYSFGLLDLYRHHDDYNKLEVYNYILEAYKNRFCIPIGRILKSSFIDNEIFEYYNIDIPKRPVITYTDYLEIKQELKKAGAKFEAKNDNFYETIKYYLNMNGLLNISRQDEILKNNSKLKQALRKTIFDICEDVILYDGAEIGESIKKIVLSSTGFKIYDSNSGLYLKEVQNCDYIFSYPSNFLWFNRVKGEIRNKTFIIDYFGAKGSFIFIHKKVTNEKIYDLANYLLEKSSYMYSNYSDKELVFAPIIYTNNVLNELKLNNDLEHQGRVSEDESRIINSTYDIFAKDKIKSKEIADAYYSDNTIVRSIESTIYDTIQELAEILSGDNSKFNLSLDGFDKEDEKINRLVDRKIDEFIQQLIVKLID